jgi:uncharacterized protein (DUF58 family)
VNLSSRSIVLLALIALSGIAQQWSAAGEVMWWRYAAALFVLGLLYEWLNVRAAALAVHCESRLKFRLGRAEKLFFSIANGSARARKLRFNAALPAALDTDSADSSGNVAAGGAIDAAIDVTGLELGEFRWLRLPVQVTGPLGLAAWTRRLMMDTTLQVVPDLLGARDWAEGRIPQGDHGVRPGTGMELHHLREYVPGDPRHSIDWKATARSQKLITRVFSEEQHLDILLILDVGRTSRTQVDGMSQFSHYINLAARFSQYAIANGDQVGLVAVADKPVLALPPMRGAAAVTQINSALGGLRPQAQETDILGAALLVQKLARRRCLLIFFTDLYGQALTGNFGRSLKLWKSQHLPFVVGLVGADIDALTEREALGETDPYVSLAAAHYRDTILSNSEAARRLGAQAIVARPAQLLSRVVTEYQLLKRQNRV